MGDFYEMFFEDAEIASQALGIVLTKRGKHQGADIPMCGVPVHALAGLPASPDRARPSRRGLRADRGPGRGAKRGAKSVVRRDVVRLVTPGTLTEDTLLDARANNYLLAIARTRGTHRRRDRSASPGSIISTAEFSVTNARRELGATLARINPNEVIVADALYSDETWARCCANAGGDAADARRVRRRHRRKRRLCDYFAVATMDGLRRDVARWKPPPPPPPSPMSSAPRSAQRPPLSPPSREAAGTTMAIDPATRANLELTRTLGGERRGSLLACDRLHA
jgi:DNA mismatch repair protein MutS